MSPRGIALMRLRRRALPAEVWLRVFSFLGATSLWRARRVCDTWKKLAEDVIRRSKDTTIVLLAHYQLGVPADPYLLVSEHVRVTPRVLPELEKYFRLVADCGDRKCARRLFGTFPSHHLQWLRGGFDLPRTVEGKIILCPQNVTDREDRFSLLRLIRKAETKTDTDRLYAAFYKWRQHFEKDAWLLACLYARRKDCIELCVAGITGTPPIYESTPVPFMLEICSTRGTGSHDFSAEFVETWFEVTKRVWRDPPTSSLVHSMREVCVRCQGLRMLNLLDSIILATPMYLDWFRAHAIPDEADSA
jgi:hypothetical protein